MAWGSGTRQWVRGLIANIAGSTVVLGQGEIMADDQGGLYGGNGVTQIKNLSPAATKSWATTAFPAVQRATSLEQRQRAAYDDPAVRLSNVAYSSPTINNVVGLSKDKTHLFFVNEGAAHGQLGVSIDGGATITWGHTFGGPGGCTLLGIVELLSGEVDVTLQYGTVTSPGQVFRSTGWNVATADATTWTLLLTASGPSCLFSSQWGFTQNSVASSTSPMAGWQFYAEYGTRISEAIAAGSAGTAAATKVYGVDPTGVARVIFDLNNQIIVPGENYVHLHGCTADDYGPGVAVTMGDTSGPSAGFSAVFYKSFANILDGLPWTHISLGGNTQCVSVAALPGGLLLLSDYAGSAVQFIGRLSNGGWGPFETVLKVPNGVIGDKITLDTERPGSLAWLTFQGTGVPYILATSDGRHIVQAHTETTAVIGGAPGVGSAYGPDSSGRVFAHRNLGDGSAVLITGTYAPGVAALDTRQVATGAGLSGGGNLTADRTLSVASMASAARWGLLAHSFLPLDPGAVATALTSGTLYVVKVRAEASAVSGVRTVRTWQIGAATAATLVTAAVYDSTGAQLGSTSADASATFNTAGPTKRDLTVGSFAVTAGQDYYLTLLFVGTTGPTLQRNGSGENFHNIGLTGAGLLFATGPTGLAAVPAPLVTGTLVTDSISKWFGLL